ncbi:MAG: universal stress protein [Hyphomicrobiales bacterium]|nr:universal stress protein [Hyphomicrobiales bacterium]
MRNILVHLDSGAQTPKRLNMAAALAKGAGARLVGVFAETAEAHRVGVVAEWPPESYRASAHAAQAAFQTVAGGLAGHAFMDLNRGVEDELLAQFVDLSRHFDMIVCGQPTSEDARTPKDLIERVVVDSGRPVLAVPHAGEFPSIGHRPMFAWNDSREAARAFVDAMPLVAPGAEALVVSIAKSGEKAALDYARRSLDLAVAHLAAYGVKATADQTIVSDIGLMDALLNRASDHGADLMALGAFGGQGYPRFSRGSGSRFMLKHMTAPVLLSH